MSTVQCTRKNTRVIVQPAGKWNSNGIKLHHFYSSSLTTHILLTQTSIRTQRGRIQFCILLHLSHGRLDNVSGLSSIYWWGTQASGLMEATCRTIRPRGNIKPTRDLRTVEEKQTTFTFQCRPWPLMTKQTVTGFCHVLTLTTHCKHSSSSSSRVSLCHCAGAIEKLVWVTRQFSKKSLDLSRSMLTFSELARVPCWHL